MFCPNCGTHLPEVGGFCPGCGAPRQQPQQAPQPYRQQAPPYQPVQGTPPAMPQGGPAQGNAPPAPSRGGPATHAASDMVTTKAPGGPQPVAIHPDVCGTPAPSTPGPVPVPYPDFARSNDAGSGATKVDGGGMASVPRPSPHPTTGDEPGTGWPEEGPVGHGGPTVPTVPAVPTAPSPIAGLAGYTERLPGPLRGADPLLLVALVIAVISGIVVLTGDVGWTYESEAFYPYYYPEDPVIYNYHTRYHSASDGGANAVGTAVIGLLLLCSALVAFLAITKAHTPDARRYVMGGLGLAVGALVASIAGGAAFASWASGEGFNDWGMGSTLWGGLVGSILLIATFAAATRWSVPAGTGGPPPYQGFQPALAPPPGPQAPPRGWQQPPPPPGWPPQQQPYPQAPPPGIPPPQFQQGAPPSRPPL